MTEYLCLAVLADVGNIAAPQVQVMTVDASSSGDALNAAVAALEDEHGRRVIPILAMAA